MIHWNDISMRLVGLCLSWSSCIWQIYTSETLKQAEGVVSTVRCEGREHALGRGIKRKLDSIHSMHSTLHEDQDEVVNWICNWKTRYKRRWRNWTRWRKPPTTRKIPKSRPRWHHYRRPARRVSASENRRPRDHRREPWPLWTMPKPNRNNVGDPCRLRLFDKYPQSTTLVCYKSRSIDNLRAAM